MGMFDLHSSIDTLNIGVLENIVDDRMDERCIEGYERELG